MKILVTVKPVVDVQLKIKLEGGKVDDSSGRVINAWDEHALEAALQIKENTDANVVVLSIDDHDTEPHLRKALAMGADEAISLNFSNAKLNSFSLAQILGKLFTEKKFEILLMGKQAQDYDSGQACQIMSTLQNIPCFNNLEKIEMNQGETFTLKGQAAEGIREFEVQPPMILTVSDSINEPRLAGPRNIMLAKKKPLQNWELSEIGLNEVDLLNSEEKYVSEFFPFEMGKKCEMFKGFPEESAKELLNHLELGNFFS